VLVSRLPDRRALTRLVRAALRHEVAQVELTRGPQKAEAHTLDLHVVGQPPLALLAEPAGAPQNGHFPLRLRPLYRAQAAQLYALLEAENVSVDGPPDTSPIPTATASPAPAPPPPDTVGLIDTLSLAPGVGEAADASPLARGMSGAAPAPVVAQQPPLAPTEGHVSATASDPRRTAPNASSWNAPLAESDPRRTAPSASWGMIHGARHEARPDLPVDDMSSVVVVETDEGAFADDPSLSVSVVFEPDDMPAAVRAMTANAGAAVPLQRDTTAAPPLAIDDDDEAPANVDEPSLSVSVVFEPDALPSALLAGIPSPLGATHLAPAPARGDVPASSIPETVADAGPPTDKSESAEPHSDEATSDDSFFDDALANFPTTEFADEAEAEAEAETSTSDGVRPPAESFVDVAVDEVELVDDAAAGGFDDDGLVPVPPPPEDDDEDATLVRLPMSSPMPAAAAREPIVRPEAREQHELTPTQTKIDPTQQSATGSGRKKKSTRRKPKEKPQLSPADDEADTPGELEAPVAAAAAVAHAQVMPVVPVAPIEEPPSSRSGRDGDHDPAIGRRIADGKYIIESLIGSGAAGAVYRATHRELRRTVAIKILHPHYQQDPQFMTSFRGEALAASQLDHPNVMRVLDFDQEADGLIYIVMEYLSGRTLQSLLDEERRLPMDRAVEIMIQVCAALSIAHDHGIIHRDIKPDNIMLVPSRNDEGTTFELVKVCDFGIAALQNPRAEDAELAATEHVIAGTPEYMSPEQARGTEVDARSDVYACGICLYELVTGRPPFLGDNPAEILIKQLEEIPKPPSQIIKGLDPILEEVILRAVQKDPSIRHQSAREMRVELKELIEPGDGYSKDDEDELSIVENVPVLDDPASGFPGFFIAFASAVLRFGRFERGHHEAAQAMKELSKSLRIALRGRSELTLARRDVQKTISFVVMTGTAEIVDLRRLLGSQLYGSFGEPFIQELVKKGVASLTLREGIPDVELHYIVEMLLGPFAGEDLRRELFSKPLRHISMLFVTDVVGRDRKLSWKVGLGASRLSRDLQALCNVRGISLKKMRETRDELVGGVARLLTRGDEVKQFIFNADLVDDAVANLRGFSSFQVAPQIIERVLHESCAEAATSLLADHDAGSDDEKIGVFLQLFAARLVTERSPKSDAAVAEFYRRKIITEKMIPRDLQESIRATTLADALVREPSQFLLTLDLIGDPETYANELATLEAAMATLARRAEASALLIVMSTLARHAKGSGKPGPRENAALRTMKSMIDKQRLLPIATTLLIGPPHQREAARQLILIAGSVGTSALFTAREAAVDPAARQIFVKVLRDAGPAGWTLLSQVLPQMEVRDDAELALVEDLLRAMPERADPVLGEAVAKFLAHPLLRPTAIAAIVPLWGERAKKPLVEALEYAEEPTRIVALGELRRLRAIDEYVVSVIERFLTMRGSAGDELRASAAAALVDVPAPLRTRAVQLLSKAVEGKRGFVAMLRGNDNNDESVVVMEAMGRALLSLDRVEGVRALRGRLSRSEGLMKARLTAVLQMA